MITISIVNQKGGCSKTSTAVNLSSVLAEKGYKTLLIDMDPQGNASSSLGIDNFNSPTIYEVLHSEISIDSAVLETCIVNLYMIASNILTAKLEREMSRNSGSEENLSKVLRGSKNINNRFNYCIIDCPPSLRGLSTNALVAYLIGRGIHREIIDYCIQTGRLYESRDYHNAVFIGFDGHGTPRYSTLRGTSGRRFVGEVNGSDKHFSFSIPFRNECSKLHLFESAIDLLSYCTLELLSGRDWRQNNYLSLEGIYLPKKIIEESTLPAALTQYLKDFPKINEIALHLDNDTAGRLAAKTIQTILPSAYIIADEPPKSGKDYNDYLKIQHRNILER